MVTGFTAADPHSLDGAGGLVRASPMTPTVLFPRCRRRLKVVVAGTGSDFHRHRSDKFLPNRDARMLPCPTNTPLKTTIGI